MTITPEEQIWTVVEAIAHSHEITASGETLLLNPQRLSKVVSELELKQILTKLEKDDKVIEITTQPSDMRLGAENGCYGISIPNYDQFRQVLNNAHSQHYGDVSRLASENFLAVCDVAMDIYTELQWAKHIEVHIPLMRDIVRFSALMPADSVNMRDRYCEFRWKALEYLTNRGHIVGYTLERDPYGHRWNKKISVIVDRYKFDKFYKKLTDVYQKRVVKPEKKNSVKTPNVPVMPPPPMPSVQKIEITGMPELQVRNVEDVSIIKGKKRLHMPKFNPTDWAKITMRFIDEQNVVITADKKQVPSDYEALGFADDKRGKPNSAWKFLFGLAQNNGETKLLSTPIPDNIKQYKRQLSDRLKRIFKNDTDPFYDPTETHVYKIKMTLIQPHADDTKADEFGVQEYLKDTMIEE